MDRAHQLLDAHVAHELRLLRGERFAELVGSEVDHALRSAASLTLDQVMHRDQVKEVAAKYVASFRLPGAIPEIVGEIATLVRNHPANDALLGDVVPRATVVEIVAVIAEMREIRSLVLRGLADSLAVQAGVGDVVHNLAAGAIGSGRRLIGRVPGLGAGVDLATSIIAPVVDQRSREVTERATRLLMSYVGDTAASAVTDAELRDAALEVWDTLAALPVREVLGSVSDEEFLDLVVVLYQAWLDLRSSDYLRTMIRSGVDVFFDTYGGTTLDVLLSEFGLGADDLVEEAMRFAPPLLGALTETGLLEAFLRRRLASFYLSDEAAALM